MCSRRLLLCAVFSLLAAFLLLGEPHGAQATTTWTSSGRANCTGHTTVDACHADCHCGWCGDRSSCALGSASGPVTTADCPPSSSASSWSFNTGGCPTSAQCAGRSWMDCQCYQCAFCTLVSTGTVPDPSSEPSPSPGGVCTVLNPSLRAGDSCGSTALGNYDDRCYRNNSETITDIFGLRLDESELSNFIIAVGCGFLLCCFLLLFHAYNVHRQENAHSLRAPFPDSTMEQLEEVSCAKFFRYAARCTAPHAMPVSSRIVSDS
jgi:hypothetical protein